MMFKNQPISIMVLFAIALHLWWAFVLCFDYSALDATAVHALHRYITNTPMLILTLTTVGVLALVGLFTRTPWVVFLLIPQQAILMMSAGGAIEAMWLGQFADGILRPHAFIIADQSYSVIAAIGHTVAIVAHARRIVR